MKIQNTRFGEMEYREEDVLTFPKGLLGFPDVKRFLLLSEVIRAPFMWLQSIDEPDLAFVVLDPWIVQEDYQLDLSLEIRERLEITASEQVLTLAITVIPQDPKQMTINLRAPLIINTQSKLCEQLVLQDDRYDVRHPVMPVSR